MKTSYIKILEELGYRKTQEDGAVLEHPLLGGLDKYVWENDTFSEVLSRHNYQLEISIRNKIANKIVSEKI